MSETQTFPKEGRSRVAIENVTPQIDAGRYPIKRTIGERVAVEADMFADGHDLLSAVVKYRTETAAEWSEAEMLPVANDHWRGEFVVTEPGYYFYTVEAWIDRFKSWRDDLRKKIDAGQDVSSEIGEGARLMEKSTQRAGPLASERGFATTFERNLGVVVDSERGRFSAWYEMFPRSFGTFKDCEAQLPRIAEMGFDVLYFPPIHPIGRSFRKGKNNNPKSQEGEPGSPWGIGASEGGHKSVHPELGTLEDFSRLVQRASEQGIDIALDIALQCSPDHPYVREHPDWFRKRPDGSIHYAENPPKKYQDIYPFDFECEDWRGLWAELKSIFDFWIAQGVRIFRVDNPHTKAFAFWEWCLSELKRNHPELVFLSEAFTRPSVMYHLAKLGFTQSYSYFPWRNSKDELIEYLTELTRSQVAEYFRPALWPNTPDILPQFLQNGGRPAFAIRLVLAATLGANYGIYGPAFELCENTPLQSGGEEYLNAEKFEIRRWDVNAAQDLSSLITKVNRIRRENPALRSNHRLRFHSVDNDCLLAYTKSAEDGTDIILTVVNLDPHHVHSGWLVLPVEEFLSNPKKTYQMHDLLTDARFLWNGTRNYVELNPRIRPPTFFACGNTSAQSGNSIISCKAMANDVIQAPAPVKTELWYKSAVIYEVHVRAFQDSNGDGIGDFRGLTSKLDYLRDLGVTAIWVLPFYPSPLKDDGYDIADYYGVHPQYGTLADFKQFMREAHCRGIRVVTELVLNHTSDQHPWFQRARRAKPGSRWRDYYVWSDSPDKYKDTRIIFKDTEISNWTWDPLAKSYYWHRFYSHQPDLNFDHAAVRQEMFDVLDFWMELGVDGVRLDAVPYLYEREGTSCENLPETHEFLKLLRKHVDENYGNRMLLAEANQWPDDAVAYFGSGRGDECHMAFHFPLMPRLFMALRMEDRIPIVDILQQTPPIPETAQWALFLRNHDELTLEMVTDEERDYMYRMYAHIHQARLNLGIRRRLAPLVGNDRKRIELLCALLFSLPGTPVIYYGDEIGMGENIYLGDRNGVRTPMQWSADKNAGFSRANPQSLYLPINLDPENHYEAVNVEVQERNRHSLLWWMRQVIALRKRWKSFGLGTLEFLQPENRKVLAYVRRYEDECILAVANLSRFVQPVELDLSAFQSRVPMEMFGHTEFPAITDKPYFLTLGPHAFYWFSLETKATAQVESSGAPVGAQARALLQVEEHWEEVFREGNRARLEAALQSWLPSRRWFGGKARTIKTVNLLEALPVPTEAEKTFLVFLQVEYVQADPETYVLPLACALGEKADPVCRDWSPLVLARVSVKHSNQDGVLYDAIADKSFCRAILEMISNRRTLQGDQGELNSMHTAVLRQLRRTGGLDLEPSISKAEQSNSSVIYGDRLILKFFRRLDVGVNPDLEIGRFLTARKFPWSPPLAGALEYRSLEDEPVTVAILSSFVPGCKSAWDYTLDTLGRFYERVQTLPAQNSQAPALPSTSVVQLAGAELPKEAEEMIGSYLQDARMLGERTALMHLTLASEMEDPNFRPEPMTPHAQRGIFQSMRNLTRQNFQLLNQRLKSLPTAVQAQAQQVLALETGMLQRFRRVYEGRIDAVRIRNHGDYHLGQILHTGKDFLIIDFEGEPAIPLSERRLKRSPLQDVAGMILSFHYASQVALLKQTEHGSLQEGQMKAAASWARYWSLWVGATFIKAYLQASRSAPYIPATEAGLQILLEAALVRNAVYEVGYELNNRPDWVKIPLEAILELMNPEGHP